MTMRSKQWYTNTSRLPNSFVNVSIGRPPLIESRQQDHRSDGRWSQNFKYVWLGFGTSPRPLSDYLHISAHGSPFPATAGAAVEQRRKGTPNRADCADIRFPHTIGTPKDERWAVPFPPLVHRCSSGRARRVEGSDRRVAHQ